MKQQEQHPLIPGGENIPENKPRDSLDATNPSGEWYFHGMLIPECSQCFLLSKRALSPFEGAALSVLTPLSSAFIEKCNISCHFPSVLPSWELGLKAEPSLLQ